MSDLQIAPDEMPDLAIEPDPEPKPTAIMHVQLEPAAPALMTVLPADFPLPALIRFVPDAALKATADTATAYALQVEVDQQGAEGLTRADLALATLRGSVKAITDHFAEPADIAHRLHKQITGVRGEWLAGAMAAITTVGRRIHAEQTRLEAIAAQQRRIAQDEANRLAREAAAKEAETAAKQNAPKAVVEQLEQQAKTAVAPPVQTPAAVAPPVLKNSSTVTTWKARLASTPADAAECNPEIAALSLAEQADVRTLLKAILEDRAPLTAIELSWKVLNGRAKADKSTMAIPGVVAFPDGGVRAKGGRK